MQKFSIMLVTKMCDWLELSMHDDHESLIDYVDYMKCSVSVIRRTRCVGTSNTMVQGLSRASVTSLSSFILGCGMWEPKWVLNVWRNPISFELNRSL